MALVARGIPFTKVKDKWNKQQFLAVSCAEKLMRTRTVRHAAKLMRLDDVEAMAPMIDFKFADARGLGKNSLDAELGTLGAEYESHVVLEAVNLANAIRKRRSDDRYSEERPLVDLAPPILRNICADACKWACAHGTRPLRVCEVEFRGGY